MVFFTPRRTFALLSAALLVGGPWLLVSRDHRSAPRSQNALLSCLKEKAKAQVDREGGCPGAPESPEDLAKIGEAVTARLGSSDARGALGRAVAQRNRLRARSSQALVPGTGGTWAPYGKGPLRFDDPNYPASYGDGFGRVN